MYIESLTILGQSKVLLMLYIFFPFTLDITSALPKKASTKALFTLQMVSGS